VNEGDGNEKRAILAIVLSLAVVWIWSSFIAPQQAPIDPVADQPVVEQQVVDGLPVEPIEPVDTVAPEPAPGDPALAEAPAAEITPDLPERTVAMRSAQWAGEWSTRGGVLRALELPGHNGPYTVGVIYKWVWGKIKGEDVGSYHPYADGDQPEALLSPTAKLGMAGGMDSAFADGDYELVSSSDGEAVFERVTASGLKITKRYSTGPEPYQGRLDITYQNATQQTQRGRLWAGVADTFEGKYTRFSNFARPASVIDGDLEVEEDLDDLLEGPERRAGVLSWFGIASRYFLLAMVPEQADWGRHEAAAVGSEHGGVFLVADDIELAPGATHELSLWMYAGPKAHQELTDLGHDLEKSIQWGFFGFFAKILYWLLVAIQGLVVNWGVAIIVLTLVVKGAFFPLTQKSFRSQQEMKKLQPLMNEMKEKYKDDREMQAQEQMRLFKEHGVNPMSGCLPMVIQMPIWFALYSTLLYSVDLYRSEFLIWQDLSSQDPFAVLPILVGVLMLAQQWMTPMTGVDPAQAKMFKLMPLIFIFIMFSLPSGLCLYITINSLLTIGQQWFIRRKYGGDLVPATGIADEAAEQRLAKKDQKKKARKKK
jgi:YidC/Oxa1 family membrane protein insertase